MNGPEPTAHDWLRRLRAREVSAREVADHCVGRLEQVAGLNAVAACDPQAVCAAADAADAARTAGDDRPLLGLPVTIKDSLAVTGMTRFCGSYAREHDRPEQDATAVARLREAGAIVLAKTAVPEYMWSYETESAIQGRTVSPYDPARTPGGSSGGEAALIASGASPLGLGTDGGGSIRVPSHYAGICGIRPSARLVPETGCWPVTRETGMIDMSTIGPMARSVDDLALALRLIAGEDGVDPFVGPWQVPDHGTVEVRALRVGFYAQDGVWPSTAATEAAVRAAAAALADAGAQIEEVGPPALAEATDLFFSMMAADGGARARADLAPAGGRHVEQMSWLLDNLRDSALSAEGYFDAVGRWSAFRARVRAFVARYDVVLSPVTPGPAPLHGCRPGDDGPLETYAPWANVQAYSVAGLPCAVVPVAAERGLPLGVQIVAGAFRDHVALAAAAAVEEATGGYAAVSWPLLAPRLSA